MIGGSLQKGSGRNYQYYRANGQNSVWTNFNAGDTVYLVFSALAGSSGGSSGGGGDEEPPDLGAVGNSKTLTDKNDGTYSLTLSVTGSAQSKEEETDINVLFIIDNSNSMSWNDSEGKNKLASTKTAVINMAEKLLENNTNSNPDAIELALMNFNASASDLLLTLAWPRISLRLLTSKPSSMQRVAKLWRQAWKPAGAIPQIRSADLKRFSRQRGSMYASVPDSTKQESFALISRSMSVMTSGRGMVRSDEGLFGAVIITAVL